MEPQHLTERPLDLGQRRAWEDAVQLAQLVSRPPAPVVPRGLGLEL